MKPWTQLSFEFAEPKVDGLLVLGDDDKRNQGLEGPLDDLEQFVENVPSPEWLLSDRALLPEDLLRSQLLHRLPFRQQ
jgi:hypothetical protein